MKKWRLIDYFDVWGNEEDGWEVNDQTELFDDLVITDDATDEDIINYLISIGYLAKETQTDAVSIDWIDDDIAEIVQVYNDMPLGRLVEM